MITPGGALRYRTSLPIETLYTQKEGYRYGGLRLGGVTLPSVVFGIRTKTATPWFCLFRRDQAVMLRRDGPAWHSMPEYSWFNPIKEQYPPEQATAPAL